MTGNSSYRHTRTGILAVQAVEAPEIVTSAWIDEQLAPTYTRLGIRAGLLAELAGIVGPRQQPVMRDLYFRPTRTLSEYTRLAERDGAIPD